MEENQVTKNYEIIVIGGSAGAIEPILSILHDLHPGNFSIIVVLHRKASSDSMLVDIFSGKSAMKVKEAEEKEPVEPGTIYIAPADYHLLIEKDRSFSLDDSEKVNFSRPSIDITFESVAETYGNTAVSVLLSGGNIDGIEGMKRIKAEGGICVVQHPESAEVDFMPRHALLHVDVDVTLSPNDIGPFLNCLHKRGTS